MSITVLVGAQWGDEGKGKIIDYLSEKQDLIVRFQGGDNAGHTVINDYGVFKLHLIPSGIFNKNGESLIGTGTVVNPDVLEEEIAQIEGAGVDMSGLKISGKAHVLMPYHQKLDELIGAGEWTCSITYPLYELRLATSAKNQLYYDEVTHLINQIKPAHIVFISMPYLKTGILITEQVDVQKYDYQYRLDS